MSANSALVNAHITRVIDDGGDAATIDVVWLQTVYSWLVSNGLDKSLLQWADPAFGVKKTGNNIERIYDLGSTWLPRSMDLTPRDSTKTTYNAMGLAGRIPAFVNADGQSQLYWGRGNRYNHFRSKQQLTIAAHYTRTQTTSDICFVGQACSTAADDTFQFTPNSNGPLVPGISLVHTSGLTGSVRFSIQNRTLAGVTSAVPVSASVTSAGTTTLVAIGTYDGTTMTAYSNGTAGAGVTTLFRDVFHVRDSGLAGARNDSGTTKPVLAVGDTRLVADYPSPNSPPYVISPNAVLTPTSAGAQFRAASIIVLGVGLTPTQAASLTSMLQTRASGNAKNIKTDYNAKGDAQIITTNVSLGADRHLHVGSSPFPFTPGDVNKRLAVSGTAAAGGPNPLGAKLFTITNLVSSTEVILDVAPDINLIASSQQVEWGTDDAAAFVAFRNEFQGQTGVTLMIPAGRYLALVGTFPLSLAFGITGLNVIGTGNPVLSDMLSLAGGLFLGGTLGALIGDVAKIVTVNAGDSILTLLSPLDAALFGSNKWALICGLDVQGFGFPPNWHYHEWVFITNVSGTTITLRDPLVHSYKSTWPEWVPGLGGPAALCPTQPNWNCMHSYNGLTINNTGTGGNCNGRNITFNNCIFPFFGPNMSTIKDAALNNCSVLLNHAGNWEIDKDVGDVTIVGGTYWHIHFFSGCSNSFTMSNAVCQGFGSTGLNVTLNNVTGLIDGISVGISAYGSTNSFLATNCDIPGGISFGGRVDPVSDTFTMSGGVISQLIEFTMVTNAPTPAGDDTIHFAVGQLPVDFWDFMNVADVTTPTALDQTPGGRPYVTGHTSTTITLSEPAIGPGVGSGDTLRISARSPPPWAVTGQMVFWSRSGMMSSFRINDISESLGHTRVSTNQTGGFPTIPGTGTISVRTHAAPVFQLTNCTGSRSAVALSGFPPGPMFSRWKYTFTTILGTGVSEEVIDVVGEALSVTFTINSVFGAGTFRLDPFVVVRASGTTASWAPIIDLTRGPRTITVTPAGVSSTPIGVGGADSGLAFPDPEIWFREGQVFPQMVGASSPGSITLEFNTDQGFADAPPSVTQPRYVSFSM